MKVLVFGRSGQVGSALSALLGERAVDSPRADFTEPSALTQLLDDIYAREPFGAVINAAAYTAVDQAETDEKRAHLVNAESPGAIARWCAQHSLPMVHYSTDYVFSGDGQKPWREEDPVAPLSAYGRTKLAGERSIAEAGGRYLILRTSWVYDAYGKNFLRTMLRLGSERETLKVVSDQHGSPTYAPHLARATLTALDHAIAQAGKSGSFPSGIYHLCNAGETTWHAFATEIFEQARKRGFALKVSSVESIPTSAYSTPARRPLNSRLDLSKAERVLGVRLPRWQDSLRECIELLPFPHATGATS